MDPELRKMKRDRIISRFLDYGTTGMLYDEWLMLTNQDIPIEQIPRPERWTPSSHVIGLQSNEIMSVGLVLGITSLQVKQLKFKEIY